MSAYVAALLWAAISALSAAGFVAAGSDDPLLIASAVFGALASQAVLHGADRP
jgi:hypothetical protein